MQIKHFVHGFLKTFVFAFLVSMVSCYKGVTTRGGAEGVGKATTQAVVISMVLVLIVDYFATALLNALGIT
jgi:phospholipid/cholesterol/gamma-HCH transport system permease protein